MALKIPLSSEEIPVGTGLIQSVECMGRSKNHAQPVLDEPVVAQIVTFANGIRHVCCQYANPHELTDGRHLCSASHNSGICPYTWANPK